MVFLDQCGRAVAEKGLWEGWGNGAEEVMGVWMDLDSKRWRGSERLRAGRGTRGVLALRVLSVQGVTARVS
jgi:hypothetical protein